MHRYTSHLAWITALIAASLALAPAAFAQTEDEKVVRDTVPLATDGTVALDVHREAVTVTTWDRDAVEYEVRIEADDAPELVEATEVAVDHAPDRLHLSTDLPDADGGLLDWISGDTGERPSVSYSLQIPRTAHLDIDDHRSTIEIGELDGRLSMDSHRSTITIERQTGDVKLDTHRSEVQLSSVTGHVDLNAHRGSLQIEELDGTLHADTHRGTLDVFVSSLTGDSFVHTYRGTIDLAFAADVGLELATEFGSRTTLDSNVELTGQMDGHNYRGEIGEGGPRLELSARRGHFNLRTR